MTDSAPNPIVADMTDDPTGGTDGGADLATAVFDAAMADAPSSVDDAVAALLAEPAPDGGAPALDMEGLRKLAQLKAAKARHTEMAKALGKVIDQMEQELVDNVLPHRASDGRWSTTVGDQIGYLSTTLWPKRHTDPDTGQPFTSDDLVAALRADNVDYLIASAVNGQTLAGWLRERVERWETETSEGGRRNAAGELVDLDGQVLTLEEAADPTDPDLALPKHVRKILTVTAQMKIAFRAR